MAKQRPLLSALLFLSCALVSVNCLKVSEPNYQSENRSTAVAWSITAPSISFIGGSETARFEKVIVDFDKMIGEGLHAGAQLAIYREGRLVLLLAAGKDVRTNKPVTERSLFCLRSTTKELTALVVAILYERSLFKYDDPVARYWPEFAQNGKQDITIGQVMSHSAGIPQNIPVPVSQWADRRAVAEGVEGLIPMWKPGTRHGYHAATYGWVADELAWRMTGQDIAGLIEKEVKQPLGIKDVYLGLPESEYYRFCPIEVQGDTDGTRAAFSDFVNSYEGLKLPLAWVSGVATAQDLARLFNIFAFEGTYTGKRLINGETQSLVTNTTNPAGDVDVVLHWPVRWGLGVINGETPSIYGSKYHPRAIGHAGGGANVAWVDPERHLSVVFLCNGMRTGGEEWERYRRIADLIYQSVDGLN